MYAPLPPTDRHELWTGPPAYVMLFGPYTLYHRVPVGDAPLSVAVSVVVARSGDAAADPLNVGVRLATLTMAVESLHSVDDGLLLESPL